VADWEEHENDLFKIISDKCKKKYPNYFTLLINARHPNIAIDLDDLYKKIQSLEVPFGEIWLIGITSVDECTLVSLYGKKDIIKYNQRDFPDALRREVVCGKIMG